MTRKRWPDGVTGQDGVLREERAARHAGLDPDRHSGLPGSSKDRERVTYPIIENRAGLAWWPTWRRSSCTYRSGRSVRAAAGPHPDRLVIDLDPARRPV
jgi:bifunctional non-homologous end joining protein LigD